MNLQLFLFSADCLLEKGKNSLQSSLSPPPSHVCTPSLSQGCSHILSHACACTRSLSHTQTQKNDVYHLQVIHTYIHLYCTHTYIHFVRIDFIWIFCFGQKFWAFWLKANQNIFPNFYNCPVLCLLSSGAGYLVWVLTYHGYCSSAAKGLAFWLLNLARKVQNPSSEVLWLCSPVIWCCFC